MNLSYRILAYFTNISSLSNLDQSRDIYKCDSGIPSKHYASLSQDIVNSQSDNSSSACQKIRLTNSALLLPLVSAKLDDISLFHNPIFRRRFSLFDHTSSCYGCSTNNSLILTYTLRVGTQDLKTFKN